MENIYKLKIPTSLPIVDLKILLNTAKDRYAVMRKYVEKSDLIDLENYISKLENQINNDN